MAKKKEDTQKKKDSKDEKLESKDDKIAELTELLQRTQADFENYKKRCEKENSRICRMAAADTIFKILPILDSFELALRNTEKHDDFVKGIELIYSQLFSLLEQSGLRPMDTKGQKFDPYKHEVLLQAESDKEEGIILEELQKGFMLHDMVLRTAKVKISKGKQDDKKTDNNK